MTRETTVQALSLAIQKLDTLIAAKVKYREHLVGPTMAAARNYTERQTTDALADTVRVEIDYLRDLADGLRLIKEAQ